MNVPAALLPPAGDIPLELFPLMVERHGLALAIGLCWPQGLPVRESVPWPTPR